MAVSVRNDPIDQQDTYAINDPVRSELAEWNERRSAGLKDRKRYEPTWHLCQSFKAGRQWVGWNPRTRRVIEEPNPSSRERHTVDIITPFHQTALGKLYVEDLRPDLLFQREDFEATSIATHTRGVAKYVWDTEVEGDKRLFKILHKCLTYGTSGAQCIFDPTQGHILGQVPVINGQPVYDPEIAREYMAQNALQGQQIDMLTIREGRITWRPLSPFQIVPPPGMEDEEEFPWIVIDTALPVTQVEMRWPDTAKGIKPQTLEALDTTQSSEIPSDDPAAPPSGAKVEGHVLISTGYELPTVDHPEGRVFIWSDQRALEQREGLPYTLKGRAHHGIIVFRYHTVDGRFWGKGIVEGLIGIQRQINRARSQNIELKDKNLGRVYARKGTFNVSNNPKGKVMELIEIPLHVDYPQETTGAGVGPWIQQEAEISQVDAERTAGLREVSLGSAPAGIVAYASLALLAEQDERRVGPVLKAVRLGIADLMLLSLELVRKYWPNGKHLAVAGPEGNIESLTYSNANLPDEFYVDVSKGTPLPTSPAIESQKIFDLFHAAIAAGTPLPPEWLADSLAQGRALPFPKREEIVQQRAAEYENYLIEKGVPIMPHYYDDDFVHINVHRQAQMAEASVPGTEQYAQALELHIQMHMQNAAAKGPTASGIPNMQGGAGIQAQSGALNLQGLAANLNAPPPASQGGAVRGPSARPG